MLMDKRVLLNKQRDWSCVWCRSLGGSIGILSHIQQRRRHNPLLNV